MHRSITFSGALAVLLLSACASQTSLPVAEVRPASLKDHALLFGSLWQPDTARTVGDVLHGASVDGERELTIKGDAATTAPGPAGIGEVRLFTQLVEPGDYRFSRFGSRQRIDPEDSAPIETFAAGQVVYMGQMLCVNVWFTCIWISIDQLGRDLYHASKAQPDIPWIRTDFRHTDATSTALDFRAQHVKLQPQGMAMHRKSGVDFPEQRDGFTRLYVETYGGNNAGAVYADPSLDVESQVLVYRMNLLDDDASAQGLSDRLREVVLEREASMALRAYFRDQAHDEAGPDADIRSELAVLLRPDGLRAGRRIDAASGQGEARRHVRFYIFSEQGWLVRYRFSWKEDMPKTGVNPSADTSPAREKAFMSFMLDQEWPATEQGDGS